VSNRQRTTIGDPLNGPGGVAVKFVCAALFGGLLLLPVYIVLLFVNFEIVWDSPWPHLFWIIPLVWGVLGIFWFERMLDLARDIVEAFFGSEK
jgi:hypothetical protein